MPLGLIIDDNRQTSEALSSMLGLWNISSQVIHDPRAGLDVLEKIIPDVILLDINMPGVNGFEVLSFLKRDPRLCKVPVIIITSDDQPETARQARRFGASDLLVKPAMPDTVEATLKRIGVISTD